MGNSKNFKVEDVKKWLGKSLSQITNLEQATITGTRETMIYDGPGLLGDWDISSGRLFIQEDSRWFLVNLKTREKTEVYRGKSRKHNPCWRVSLNGLYIFLGQDSTIVRIDLETRGVTVECESLACDQLVWDISRDRYLYVKKLDGQISRVDLELGEEVCILKGECDGLRCISNNRLVIRRLLGPKTVQWFELIVGTRAQSECQSMRCIYECDREEVSGWEVSSKGLYVARGNQEISWVNFETGEKRIAFDGPRIGWSTIGLIESNNLIIQRESGLYRIFRGTFVFPR